jgi:predicted RNA binding protein YcfA (HicA-like mRNA interferase family)
MPKLKRLSGADLVRILGLFGFEQISQRGSHIKLRRFAADGSKQTLTLPNHNELERGTLKAILRQSARYIPENELIKHFYSD